MRKGRVMALVLALCLLVGMTGCSEKNVQETPGQMSEADEAVINAVESLFSNNCMAIVQYSATDFLLCMLNSSHEQQAEPLNTSTSEDEQENVFGKIYRNDNTVVYLKSDGEIQWGPEYSPIDFIEKVVEQHKAGAKGITLEIQNIDELYEQAEDSTDGAEETGESITGGDEIEPDTEVIEGVVESDGTDNSGELSPENSLYTYKMADMDVYRDVYSGLGDEAADATRDSMVESIGGSEDSVITIELTVYPGTSNETFEAYLKYTVDGDEYLGWYVANCMPIAEWKLGDAWYNEIQDMEAEDIYEMYNTLMDELQQISSSALSTGSALGVTVTEYMSADEETQRAYMEQAEALMIADGYTYNEGADLDLWYEYCLNDMANLGEDNSDVMEALRTVALARAIWISNEAE